MANGVQLACVIEQSLPGGSGGKSGFGSGRSASLVCRVLFPSSLVSIWIGNAKIAVEGNMDAFSGSVSIVYYQSHTRFMVVFPSRVSLPRFSGHVYGT